MLPNIGAPELIIILIVALIVVGPGKLPDVGSALGKSIREFRKAATDVKEQTSLEPVQATAAPAPAAAPAATAASVAAVTAPPAPVIAPPAPPAPPAPVAVVADAEAEAGDLSAAADDSLTPDA